MVQWVIKFMCGRCSVTKEVAGVCQVCGGPTQRIDI